MTQPATQKLDDEQVLHVAKLSRLKLKAEDVHRYAEQLTSILGYVEQLSAVQTEGVEPMAHPLPLHNVLRDDEVQPALPVEAVLANAPKKDPPFFAVPKVLDQGEGA